MGSGRLLLPKSKLIVRNPLAFEKLAKAAQAAS